MMVRNEDKIQARKKQIIDALKVRLSSDVYSRITVQDIAQESGFSKGGVLHYFPSKEDIYFALIEDIFSEIDRAHQEVVRMDLKAHSTTSLSALVGVENFILDKTNVRVMINLIL
jgi:AcrR family transcriptional regulator